MRLNCGTIRYRLVRVNGIVQFLTVEKLTNQLTNLRNTRRTTNHNHFMNVSLRHLRIAENLLKRRHRATKFTVAKRLEARTCEHQIQINTVRQSIDFNGCLCGTAQTTLGTLTRGSKTTQCANIILENDALIFLFKFLDTPIDQETVKVLTTAMSITSRCLHFEDTVVDRNK